MAASELAGRMRVGWLVMIGLMVLTVAEYLLLLATPSTAIWRILLVVFQVLDAGLILWYFMHLGQLWHTEER